MQLRTLDDALSVCKVASADDLDLQKPFFFIAKTGDELSLVCRTQDVPHNTAAREDGWRGFRVEGTLDFSLIGILSSISGILARGGISIFAVSTYDTDYILVKQTQFERAMQLLAAEGYTIAAPQGG